MGETNSHSVAHVGYDISPLSRVEKYRNPRATEGESIYHFSILLFEYQNFEILSKLKFLKFFENFEFKKKTILIDFR
jgi:hypothetical protein